MLSWHATDTQSLRERLYTQLSGGEKQRVQLARVFAQVWRAQDAAQRLLLLDEPTSALDLIAPEADHAQRENTGRSGLCGGDHCA